MPWFPRGGCAELAPTTRVEGAARESPMTHDRPSDIQETTNENPVRPESVERGDGVGRG